MGIIPFKFSEYILSVYHNGIVRSNSTRKDACWRLSCVALRSHVAMVQSPVRGIPSNAMYPTFNLNQMETKMHWDKRNLKLRNLHKLLSPCRGTCLHVSMKFTERSISFDLWIKKKRCILNRPDGYFWILCPWNKSADHTGEPWTKHYCTDSSQSQLLSSVSWHVHKCTICTSINAPDNECRTAAGRRWSLHLTTLPVFKGQHSLLYSYSKRKGGGGGEGRVRLKRDGTRWRTGGEVKGKLANGVGSHYSHTTSERGVSNITNGDAHTSAASSRLNWRPRRFKWTCPFRRKTKSGF